MSERSIDVIRRASRTERKMIEVAEWEGLKLYFNKLTTADIQGIADRNPKDTIERNMYLLVSKAQVESGEPAFNVGDLHFLRSEADFMVVQRVINFMFESAVSSVEEAKEAIKEDPISAPV